AVVVLPLAPVVPLVALTEATLPPETLVALEVLLPPAPPVVLPVVASLVPVLVVLPPPAPPAPSDGIDLDEQAASPMIKVATVVIDEGVRMTAVAGAKCAPRRKADGGVAAGKMFPDEPSRRNHFSDRTKPAVGPGLLGRGCRKGPIHGQVLGAQMEF